MSVNTFIKKQLKRFNGAPFALVLVAISPVAYAQTEQCYYVDTTPMYSEDLNSYIKAAIGENIDKGSELAPDYRLESHDGYQKLMTPSGEALFNDLYEVEVYGSLSYSGMGSVIAKRNGYYGMLDAQGKIVFDFEYDKIEPLNDGQYIVSKYVNSQLSDALVDASGNWIYPRSNQFESGVSIVGLFYDRELEKGYFRVTDSNRSGLIDDTGAMLIPAFYDALEIERSCESRPFTIGVRMNDNYGLINRDNEVLLPLKEGQRIEGVNFYGRGLDFRDYDEEVGGVTDFEFEVEDSFEPENQDNFDDNNIDQETVVVEMKRDNALSQIAYDQIANRDGLYIVKKDEKLGMFSSFGEMIQPIIYEHIYAHEVYDSTAWTVLAKDNKEAVMRKGQITLPLSDIRVASELMSNEQGNYKLVPFQKGGLYGFLNAKLTEVAIPAEYETVQELYGADTVMVQKNGKEFLLSLSGERIGESLGDYHIIQFSQIDDTPTFMISSNNKQGMMDLNGESVMPLEYDFIERRKVFKDFDINEWPFKYLINFIIAKEGQYGLLDKSGQSILAPTYSRIAALGTTPYFIVEQSSADTPESDIKQGLLDSAGKLVVAIKYDKIYTHPNGDEGKVYMVNRTTKTEAVYDKYLKFVEIRPLKTEEVILNKMSEDSLY